MIKATPHPDFLQDIFSSSEAPLSLLYDLVVLAFSPWPCWSCCLSLWLLHHWFPTIQVLITMTPSPQPIFLLAKASSRDWGEHPSGKTLRNEVCLQFTSGNSEESLFPFSWGGLWSWMKEDLSEGNTDGDDGKRCPEKEAVQQTEPTGLLLSKSQKPQKRQITREWPGPSSSFCCSGCLKESGVLCSWERFWSALFLRMSSFLC